MIDAAFARKLEERLAVLEQRLSDPKTAADRNLFRTLISEHSSLKKRVQKANTVLRLRTDLDEHRALAEDEATDEELRQLAEEEIPGLEQQLEEAERVLKIALLPPDPAAERDVIMEIRAGTGGEEAGLFASDLFRMYSRYAESRGWKTGIIDANQTSTGGYKEIVFSVEGERVYETLQYESGVHRVQRIPVTESSGRIHTSAATVAVLPEAVETDEIEIKPEELRVDRFCSSGPGGQSVNTTYSAVRITHIPTGLIAQSQDERSQHRNKEKALAVLRARLLDLQRREETERLGTQRRSQIGTGDRSEKIRTYNFPQNRVTDHRIGLTLYTLMRVMEGELSGLLTALYEQDMDARVQRELEASAGSRTDGK
ncbi:MAG: peptide chain release factor 1 [Kiritimatiellae bacterium]|nr:peptide chain release factor 1 [Kiritimatiellia bacterium]